MTRFVSEPRPSVEVQRVDKWLWFARVVKSRTAAADLVTAGKVRINRGKADKPSAPVKSGDVVTVAVHRTVRVLKVLHAGSRRGPPAEARLLFDELPVEPSSEGRAE